MARSKASTSSLAPDQRRLVIGIAIAQVTLLSLSASLNYVLPAIVEDFQASPEDESLCRQISSIASLLVVFLAGVLGERLGERRVLFVSATLFALGSVLVALAPSMSVVTLGMLIANVGKAVLVVVALAMLASRISDPDGRATAFATISSLVPVAYLLMPLMAGAIVEQVGWRWVAGIWVLCGLVSMGAIARLLPKDGPSLTSGEMWTPALAGLVLATAVQFVSDVTADGLNSATIGYGVVCLGACVILVLAYRRLSAPTLSLAPLRHGGVVLLLIVVILFSFTNLFYYSTLLYQVVYGYSAFGAAVLMVPTQVCSILGAIVARKLLQRRGIAFTGTGMISLLGVALLATVIVSVDSSILVPIVVVSTYALASIAAFVALTNAIMNLAVPGDEGVTASYKSAASNFGGAVGIAVMTVVVTFAGTASMQHQMEAAGMTSEEAQQAGWAMIQGTSPEDAADLYGIPLDEAQTIDAQEKVAFVDAYKAQGIVGGLISLLTAAVFYASRRRYEHLAEAPGTAHSGP